MSLADLVGERVTITLEGGDKAAVLRELAALLADDVDGVGDHHISADRVHESLDAREQLASTGVGSGVAIPHGRVAGLESLRAALAVHKKGVAFDAVDGEPVHVLVAILAPEGKPSQHLKTLAAASRVLRDANVRKRLLESSSVEEALSTLRAADSR